MIEDTPVQPGEDRRAALHRERSEAIDGLRFQIETLVAREPELRQEIAEVEKTERTTIAELEKTERATIAELEKTQRATLAELEQAVRAEPENEELEDELERKRAELDEELTRTRTGLEEELERTRAEFAEELARLRGELATIGPTLIDTRCKLGMKMSDFALDENDGHEQAIEYLKPLLAELRSAYTRALSAAKHDASEAEEELKTLQAERQTSAEATLPVVERRFQPLIDAEVIGVSIEQAGVRVARHQLALLDSDDPEPSSSDLDAAEAEGVNLRLARELELEAALAELDAARAKVSALQEEKKAAVYHYSHPAAEKRKQLGGELAKRFGRHR